MLAKTKFAVGDRVRPSWQAFDGPLGIVLSIDEGGVLCRVKWPGGFVGWFSGHELRRDVGVRRRLERAVMASEHGAARVVPGRLTELTSGA